MSMGSFIGVGVGSRAVISSNSRGRFCQEKAR